jgi:sugar phosphate isomerase/epimerase
MKIAVFTVCMPEFTPEDAAPKLREMGYDGVEWRTTSVPAPGAPVINYWTGNRCSIDPATIRDRAASLKALCRKHKLAMPILGTYVGYNDLALIEGCMEAGREMGVKGLRVSPGGYNPKDGYDKLVTAALKGWEKVVKLGKKHGVKPLFEIHMGNLTPSCSAARRFADHFSPDDLGVIHDAGNMVCEGFEQWSLGLDVLGHYLAHVHVKNGMMSIQSGDADGNLRWGYSSDTLRHGEVNWRDLLDALKRVGYDGWLSLEDFSPGDTIKKLADNATYLRTLIKETT